MRIVVTGLLGQYAFGRRYTGITSVTYSDFAPWDTMSGIWRIPVRGPMTQSGKRLAKIAPTT